MVKKILFITLSNIGDVILTIPTLVFLSNKYPKAKFDLVCDRRSYELLKNFPFVKKIFFKEKKNKFFSFFKLIFYLRKENYDIAVDLRTDFMLYFVHAKKKFFKVKNLEIHSAIKHFQSLKVNNKLIRPPTIQIPREVIDKLECNNNLNKIKILALGLGSNDPDKIWQIDKYVKLFLKIKNNFELLILVGDHNDSNQAEIFIKNVNFPLINFCGKTTLLETAYLIKKSNLFIGNDSGLGHIASAVNTKSFIIFGKGYPHRYKPFRNNSFFYQNKNKNLDEVSPKDIFDKLKNSSLII